MHEIREQDAKMHIKEQNEGCPEQGNEVLDNGEVSSTILNVFYFIILFSRDHRIRRVVKAVRLKKEMDMKKKRNIMPTI